MVQVGDVVGQRDVPLTVGGPAVQPTSPSSPAPTPTPTQTTTLTGTTTKDYATIAWSLSGVAACPPSLLVTNPDCSAVVLAGTTMTLTANFSVAWPGVANASAGFINWSSKLSVPGATPEIQAENDSADIPSPTAPSTKTHTIVYTTKIPSLAEGWTPSTRWTGAVNLSGYPAWATVSECCGVLGGVPAVDLTLLRAPAATR